jgi:SPP1 family predicted phage head-tail adaptor
MSRLRSGQLNTLVEIGTLSEVTDGGGGVTGTAFYPVADDWARVQADSGGSRWQARQDLPSITHLVSLRYRSDLAITRGMAVRYGETTLQIACVNDVDNAHRDLELGCTEITCV